MASEYQIICENLVKIYQTAELETFALQGLDLHVPKGEMLGMVGVSGSGKSTLMNILGGLDRPSAGRVWVGGKDLLKLSDSALNLYRRNQVGFVWQQVTRNLIPYLNALENITFPLALSGANGRTAERRARDLLEMVGLSDRWNSRLVELSGGEQQRVAIALAMANQPSLLLADEPTGELDTRTAKSVYEIFQRLIRETGVTILIVSHDPGIARYVDRVVEIRDGKLATETIRQPAGDGTAHPETYQRLIVLDSAGRFQIPKEYLEQYRFGRRIRLEATEDGLLIQPARPAENEQAGQPPQGETTPSESSGGWWLKARRLWKRAVRGQRTS